MTKADSVCTGAVIDCLQADITHRDKKLLLVIIVTIALVVTTLGFLIRVSPAPGRPVRFKRWSR